VGVRHGETVPDLLDAVAIRATRALELVPYVPQQPKVSVVPILMGLQRKRWLLRGDARRGRAGCRNRLGRVVALLKESRAFPGDGKAVRHGSCDAALGRCFPFPRP
jgi:hypothetical protein